MMGWGAAVRRSAAATVWALLAVIPFGHDLRGQDVLIRSEVDGHPVPQAYWDDIQRQPSLFTFPTVWGRADTQEAGPHVVSGTLPVLVIPALFSNSGRAPVSADQIRRTLFTGPSASGTLTEFYHALSGGRLTVTGDVTPWVETPFTLEEVTAGQAGFGPQARVLEYILSALELADRHVDYGLFDNDGSDGMPNSGDDDGVVDVVAFEFAEVSGSCGGPGIWPHRSAISWRQDGRMFTSTDNGPRGPIRVDGYIMQSVVECSGDRPQTANVIGHELGHTLGLPDLYHPVDGILPTERRWVIGCWGLMAAGSWGCGDPSVRVEAFGPTRMSPWSLAQLGWVEFQTAAPDVRYHEFVIEPTRSGGRPLVIPFDERQREALVLEYRTKEGFDAPIPAAGVLAYHWDAIGALRPEPGSNTPYLFVLEEGDGEGNLVRTHPEGGNRGEAADVLGWPGSPPFMSATSGASTLRNDGSPSTVTVHSVDVRDGHAVVRVSTASTPAVVELATGQPTVFSPYIANHVVSGGAQPYTVEVVEGPEWLATSVTNDRLSIMGVPLGRDAARLALQLTDALGTVSEWEVTLSPGPFTVSPDRLAGSVLRDSPLVTDLEAGKLDEPGNGNGRLDIGDVRRHLVGNR